MYFLNHTFTESFIFTRTPITVLEGVEKTIIVFYYERKGNIIIMHEVGIINIFSKFYTILHVHFFLLIIHNFLVNHPYILSREITHKKSRTPFLIFLFKTLKLRRSFDLPHSLLRIFLLASRGEDASIRKSSTSILCLEF